MIVFFNYPSWVSENRWWYYYRFAVRTPSDYLFVTQSNLFENKTTENHLNGAYTLFKYSQMTPHGIFVINGIRITGTTTCKVFPEFPPQKEN